MSVRLRFGGYRGVYGQFSQSSWVWVTEINKEKVVLKRNLPALSTPGQWRGNFFFFGGVNNWAEIKFSHIDSGWRLRCLQGGALFPRVPQKWHSVLL